MSRIIKFRAWLPSELDDEDKPIKYQMCYDLAFEDYEPINDLLAGVENLMQYTGLKDKNGKEIYEGDIVDYGGVPQKIVWRQKSCAFFVEGVSHLHQIHGEDVAVIGNIYENPDLSKEGVLG